MWQDPAVYREDVRTTVALIPKPERKEVIAKLDLMCYT